MPPMREPTRIPFFTQVLTRQPLACTEASGSAARIVPAFKPSLNLPNSEKCSGVYCAGGLSNSGANACSRSIDANLVRPRGGEQTDRFHYLLNLLLAGRKRGHHRQAIDRLQQTH